MRDKVSRASWPILAAIVFAAAVPLAATAADRVVLDEYFNATW